MKKVKVITALLAISIFVSLSASAQHRQEWLKSNTPVFVELAKEVVSEDCVVGQDIDFKVCKPVLSENNVELIHAGAKAVGRVKRLTKYEMEIEVTFVESISGRDIRVEGGYLLAKRTRQQCCVIFEMGKRTTASVQSNTQITL